MGNTQGGGNRRERTSTSDAATFMRPRGYSTVDDECPVQVCVTDLKSQTRFDTFQTRHLRR